MSVSRSVFGKILIFYLEILSSIKNVNAQEIKKRLIERERKCM